MKNQLTENQQQALNVFDQEIIEHSDYTAEGNRVDYVFLRDLIDLLVKHGWTTKSAEGTVGSLTDTPYLQFNDTYEGEDGYWLSTDEEVE